MAFLPPMLMALGSAAATAAGGAVAAGGTAMATAGASSALGLGSTLLGAGGTMLEGIASSRAADFNAKVADMQARQASEQGALAASEAIRTMNQRTATGRATAAQSGFEATGSVRDLLQQVERSGYMDMMTAVYDGSVRRASAENNAALQESASSNALWGGVIGAGTQAVSGLSDYYKRTGAVQMTV